MTSTVHARNLSHVYRSRIAPFSLWQGTFAVAFTLTLLLVLVTTARADPAGRPGYLSDITEVAYQQNYLLGDFTPPPHDIVFSEICYWQQEGKSEWIEFTNISSETIDIQDWYITDGGSLDITPAPETLRIAPRCVVTVILDGTGGAMLTDAAKNTIVLHTAADTKGNSLGDHGGHLAMYSAPQRHERPMLRAYVAWGYSPGQVIADAMQHRRWFPFGPFWDRTPLGSGKVRNAAPNTGGLPGGSIGLIVPTVALRYTADDWGVFLPSEVNPGRIEIKRGISLAPFTWDGAKTSEGGYATLAANRSGPKDKYQFQLAKDAAFTQIVTDITTEHTNYHLEKPIPPNSTYYWRGRLVYPDGEFSQWSGVRRLIRD